MMTDRFSNGESPDTEVSVQPTGQPFPIAATLIFAAGILLLFAGVVHRWSAENTTTADHALDTSRFATHTQPSASNRVSDHPAAGIGSSEHAVPTPSDLAELDAALADRIRSQIRTVVDRPDDGDAIGRLGLLYEAHGFRDLARTCYERADHLTPTTPRWRYLWAVVTYKQGDRMNAEAALHDVVKSNPHYAAARERLGRLLLDRGDFEAASACFQRVVELRPSEAAGYLDMARLALAMKRFDAALTSINAALRIAPMSAEANFLLGRASRGLGRSREAADAFAAGRASQESLVRDPWREALAGFRVTASADHARALLMMDRGRLSESIVMLQDVVRRLPTNIEAVNNLAIAYLRAQRLDDARATLNRAMRLNPLHFVTHINLSGVLLAKGNTAGALAAAEEAMRLAPDSGRAVSAKANALARLGKLDRAIDAYQDAVALDGRDAKSFVGLGEALVRQHRWADAALPLETAVALQPKSALSRYNLGIVYAQLGRFPDAIDSLRVAVTLDPTHKRAAQALVRCEALVTAD